MSKKRTAELFANLARMGFSNDECASLRRISMTLHRWFEKECGDGDEYGSWAIERDEGTGKPYFVRYPNSGPPRRRRIRDLESGAQRRLEKIMSAHPDLIHYIQTDPRGAPVYILRRSDIPDGASIDSVYTRGLCVSD